MLKFRRGDIDAFFGVLFDGMPKIITGVVVLTPILGAKVMFGQLLPSIALGILLGSLFFWWLGEQVAKSTNDDSIVALPGGVNAGRFFVWLFAIMLPVYQATNDPVLALFVGIGANILSSIVSIILAFVGPSIMKLIPKEALFGSLAGGALAWLTFATLNDMLATPIIAFASVFIVLGMYLGKIKTKISPALLSIIVGIILGFATGAITMEAVTNSFENFGFYIPGAMVVSQGYFRNLISGILEALKYIPIIFAFSLGETVSNIQGIEQADLAGDKYDRKKALVGVNIVSLVSAFFGNPFCIGIWWGHPSWKELKAGRSYQLLVGATYLILAMTGIIALATSIIPLASVLPILVFIGLISLQGAFEDAKPKYYGIMALAFVIPIIEWGSSAGGNLGFLANGAMLISIIWATAFMFIATDKWKNVAITFLVGAITSILGLIHTGQFFLVFNLNELGELTNISLEFGFKEAIIYLVAAVLSFIFFKTKFIKYDNLDNNNVEQS